MKALIIIISYLLIPTAALASELTSLGTVALNMVEPINIVADFIGTACMITGITMIFGAFLKYLQYRVNPLVAPISTIIMLFIFGVVLLCLPFIYLLTESGIEFHHHF